MTAPEPTQVDESPWPYTQVGDKRRVAVTEQEILPKQKWTARHPDAESGRDLPAMYMLLAIVHSLENRLPEIFTSEIQNDAPEFGKIGTTRDVIRFILNEESIFPDFYKDLETAMNYVEADWNNPQAPRRIPDDNLIFDNGMVLYRGKDIHIPSGCAFEVLKKLYENLKSPVPYDKLSENSSPHEADENLRKIKGHINEQLELYNAPYSITAKRTRGYVLNRVKS